MVTDIAGGVSIAGTQKKIELLAYLEPDMTLQIEAGAHLSVTFFASSVEYRFTGPVKIKIQQDRIGSGPGKSEMRVIPLTQASTAKKFTAAQRESVAQAAYEMRAARPGLRLNDPVDSRLTGDDVSFSWEGPRTDKGYDLTLFDSRNNVLYRTSLMGNIWRPAEGLLEAGKLYAWEIRAEIGNGEMLTARAGFSVSDSAAAKAIRSQRPQAGASFSERVLYAIFLEENGFKYDARRIWQELARERPDDAVVKERSIR
ncbi:MAG: hypothetical protein A2Z95_03475 [Gallionellales bacterium GWA2_60_18]|nr:MAG: hypothetical protein A2Z95_03475 [Gallionellales bacterium GWA2_60_18]